MNLIERRKKCSDNFQRAGKRCTSASCAASRLEHHILHVPPAQPSRMRVPTCGAAECALAAGTAPRFVAPSERREVTYCAALRGGFTTQLKRAEWASVRGLCLREVAGVHA